MRVVPERGAFEPVPVHSQGSPRGSVVYKAHVWDFPGGPVVKTPHFQGRDSIPGWGARSHMPSGMANKARSCPVVSVPVLGVFLETEHLDRLQRRLLGSPQPSGLSVALDVLPACSAAALQVQKDLLEELELGTVENATRSGPDGLEAGVFTRGIWDIK